MRDIFKDLFVLELANNHWGDVNRGVKIIEDFSKVVRDNEVKAAIKLQFRDVDNFIHKDFLDSDSRYIKKTLATKMSKEDYKILIDAIKENGCMVSVTPFDEASVRLCSEFDVDIIKIASSDINDWQLLTEIVKLKKPVILSTGGAFQPDIDKVVDFLKHFNIEFAINHCVSLYPTEKHDIELNQIDYLKNRYPNIPIGFSTHEYDLDSMLSNIMMAYAKGAILFERHIDINENNIPVSPYCSTPEDVDKWIKAYKRAVVKCGSNPSYRRFISNNEYTYIKDLKRGCWLKRDLMAGSIIQKGDVYFAIPLQEDQLTGKEFRYGMALARDMKADQPLTDRDVKGMFSDYLNLITGKGIQL